MSKMYQPFDLAGISLKNRVVMAPMTRSRAFDRVPTDLMVEYYRQRAGAGLIIAEASQISLQGIGYLYTPGIHTDEQVRAWQKVTAAVHEEGSKIFDQLWHVGRVSHAALQVDGAAPVSSTAKRAESTTSFSYDEQGNPAHVPVSSPRPLKTEEIAGIVEDYANAAARAIEAGFDGVEIHGANGYLIEQFINASINDRDDEYSGATIEGRLRFVLEVVDKVCERIGSHRVGLRISPFNRVFDMPAFDEEVETWLTLARELNQRNLAYVHIGTRVELNASSEGQALLTRFREEYDGVLILAGEYNKVDAERDIDSGLIDLVAFGRSFVANPDLVERLKNDWPLAEMDPTKLYGGDHTGYTDYPNYQPDV